MEAVNLIQGSPEWLAFRKDHYPASEAPSMMNVGKFEPKKTADLALVRLGLKVIEISDYQQKIFDEGHETEENARPLAAQIIGEPLSNMTGRMDVYELAMGLSASLDGVNFGGDILFEHKIWNEKLAVDVRKKNLSPYYYWQLEQQLLVSGAEKVIFVTSDSFKISPEDLEQIKDKLAMYSEEQTAPDGSKFHYAANCFEYMEYRAQPGFAEQLVQGWADFEQVVAEVLVEDEAWLDISKEYLAVNSELILVNAKKKELEERLNPYKTALISSAKSSGTTKMIGGGVEVGEMIRKGGLDEKLLLELLTPEQLSKCRKADTSSWSVKVAKSTLTQEQLDEAKVIQAQHGNKSKIQIGAITPNQNVLGAGAFNF
jgi:hypothetical protein